MKKSIMGGLLVFIFTFMAVFLALDNRQETYAMPIGDVKQSYDSRIPDVGLYRCLAQAKRNLQMSYVIGTELGDLSIFTYLECDGESSILGGYKIKNTTGLEKLVNLQTLKLPNNNISSIDLSKMTKLKYLNLSHNKLKSVDLSNQSSIQELNLSNNLIANTFTLPSVTKLYKIDLSNNKINKINNIDKLYVYGSGNCSNCGTKELFIQNNYLSSKPNICDKLGKKCNFGKSIVKYNTSGGIPTPDAQNLEVGKIPAPNKQPLKDGYNFAGWKNSQGYTYNVNGNLPSISTTSPAVITYTAQWSIKNSSSSSKSSSKSSSNNGGNNNSNNCDGKLVKLVFDCGKQKNCQKPSDYSVCKHKGTDYAKIYFKKTGEHNALIASKTGYDFLYWLSKDGKRRYSPTCKDSNGKSIKDCKTSISISKKNTLTAVWQKEKASESEVVSTSKNVFMRMMMVIVALFVAAGFGVLSYSYLHAGPNNGSAKKTTKKSSKK